MIYDPETNIICIELAHGKIKYASDFGNFIIHFTKNKRPILLEILDATKFIGQFDNLKNLKKIKKAIPAS